MFRGFCFLFGPLLLPLAGPLGLLLWALSQGQEKPGRGKQTGSSLAEKVVLTVKGPVSDSDEQREPVSAPPEPGAAPPESGAAPEVQPVASEPDDLRRIDGIGPKIAGVLNEAGILTFSQLAEVNAGQLKQIVKSGGVRIAYPDTWPEQAALAAAGDWEGLDALQATLKGGRRV